MVEYLDKIWPLLSKNRVLQYQTEHALVFDFQHVISCQVLVRRVAPSLLSNKLVKLLCKGLRKSVCNSLHHDVVVVITLQPHRACLLLLSFWEKCLF